MKHIDHIQQICFLGIGGIGMSALARYFHAKGVKVCGYDKTPGPITHALESAGMQVSYQDDPASLPANPQLVVHTPAIPKDNKLLLHYNKNNIPSRKRAEVLGMISENIPTIAVAGTHGKTTISAMLTHIFKEANLPCLAFLGGISANYNTNYIGDEHPGWMIAEADEYDRSFLHLRPSLALISSIDADHFDIYGNMEELYDAFKRFAGNIRNNGVLITKKGVMTRQAFGGKHLTYHPDHHADYRLKDVILHQGRYRANAEGLLTLNGMEPGHPGRHNLENALAAAALAHQAGVSTSDIKRGISSFKGVKRRFELCFSNDQMIYVDDYAHHPNEITACIQAAKEIWPGKKVTGIFQPHLFSRTRDLAADFGKSLSLLDDLILLDIYPAREAPIRGVNAQMLLKQVQLESASYCRREDLTRRLYSKDIEVLISMGAGDIDRLTEGITQVLEKKSITK